MKICSRCGRELSLSEFHGYRHGRQGAQAWCKRCANAYRRAYRERRKLGLPGGETRGSVASSGREVPGSRRTR